MRIEFNGFNSIDRYSYLLPRSKPQIVKVRPFLHDTNEYWLAEKVDVDGHIEPVIVVQV